MKSAWTHLRKKSEGTGKKKQRSQGRGEHQHGESYEPEKDGKGGILQKREDLQGS